MKQRDSGMDVCSDARPCVWPKCGALGSSSSPMGPCHLHLSAQETEAESSWPAAELAFGRVPSLNPHLNSREPLGHTSSAEPGCFGTWVADRQEAQRWAGHWAGSGVRSDSGSEPPSAACIWLRPRERALPEGHRGWVGHRGPGFSSPRWQSGQCILFLSYRGSQLEPWYRGRWPKGPHAACPV